jgi:hypothetical protein
MTVLGFFRPGLAVLSLAGLLIAGCAAPAPGQVAAKALSPSSVALNTDSSNAAPGEGPVRGPILGYVFDQGSLGIRALPGIPGASYLGNPLPLGFTAEFAEVSPSHQYALGVEAGTGRLFVIDLRPELPAAEPFPSAAPGADRIFFSPLGKAAALYHRESKQAEILTGFPDQPSREGNMDLAGLPGVLTALAVSDDGQLLAAAASQGSSRSESGALYAGSPGEDLRPVGPLGRAAALSFFNDSQDLLIADAGRSEVIRVRNIHAGAEWTVLASQQDGIRQPSAVAASRDNNTAFAADVAGRRVAWIPLAGGPVEFADCPCKPTQLSALAAGSVFRLTPASSAPLYMLDAQREGPSARPRVLFIPAPESGSADAVKPAETPRGRVRR